MKPGDIIIFHSLTPHIGGANNTGKARKILFLTYNTISSGSFYERHRKKYLAEVEELGERFE